MLQRIKLLILCFGDAEAAAVLSTVVVATTLAADTTLAAVTSLAEDAIVLGSDEEVNFPRHKHC